MAEKTYAKLYENRMTLVMLNGQVLVQAFKCFCRIAQEILAIHNLWVDEADVIIKDGFGSDTDEIGSECHLLPHFNPDMNENADLV